MKQSASTQDGKTQPVLRILLFLIAAIGVIIIMPMVPHFEYDFEQGHAWQHQDLIAPVTFPIEKTEEEIREEREAIINDFIPYYVKLDNTPNSVKNEFAREIRAGFQNDNIDEVIEKGNRLIDEIYKQEILRLAPEHQEKTADDNLRVSINRVTRTYSVKDFVKIRDARETMLEKIQDQEVLDRGVIRSAMQEVLEPNVVYDKQFSEERLNELLNSVAKTRGVVEAGEVIIRQGEIITGEKAQVLTSLSKEYVSNLATEESRYFVIAGYVVIILLLFLMYYLYLQQFHFEYLRSYRALIMLLVNFLLFVLISSYIVSDPAFSIYLVPFCIVPIVLIAFFGSRLAFITHILIVMLVALIVPNPYEFLLVQFIAGFTATLSMLRVRYLSHFFGAVLLTFAAYSMSYLGYNLIQTGDLTKLNYMTFLWFGGNFILALLAYPLIYAHEKLFGFVSDITLLELGDVNNSLLRELSVEAPGSFQHSLQVANLSETVLNALNGNALLARVAALYHDIGKMEQPGFFIENQQYMQKNPHDDLPAEQSCQIIIDHVRKGAEKAKKFGLPAHIIDFIYTHHGTSRLEYFYRNEINKHSEDQVDEMKFRYPGPKPRTKEEAVVMVVDSVEAASRSLKSPNEKSIDELIDKIVDSKLNDRQLDNADITLSEISEMTRLLKKLIKSLYHVRIEYPEDQKVEKKETQE